MNKKNVFMMLVLLGARTNVYAAQASEEVLATPATEEDVTVERLSREEADLARLGAEIAENERLVAENAREEAARRKEESTVSQVGLATPEELLSGQERRQDIAEDARRAAIEEAELARLEQQKAAIEESQRARQAGLEEAEEATTVGERLLHTAAEQRELAQARQEEAERAALQESLADYNPQAGADVESGSARATEFVEEASRLKNLEEIQQAKLQEARQAVMAENEERRQREAYDAELAQARAIRASEDKLTAEERELIDELEREAREAAADRLTELAQWVKDNSRDIVYANLMGNVSAIANAGGKAIKATANDAAEFGSLYKNWVAERTNPNWDPNNQPYHDEMVKRLGKSVNNVGQTAKDVAQKIDEKTDIINRIGDYTLRQLIKLLPGASNL